MKRNHARTFGRTAGCAAIAAVAGALAAPASIAQQPDVIYLTGTVRDFMQSHPDFAVDDTGHVANNVVLTSASNRPVFTGAGFGVGTQWRNSAGDPIPPHLAYNGGMLLVGSKPVVGQNVLFDSWDSSTGTYDADEAGPPPPMDYGAHIQMPSVSPPKHQHLGNAPGNNNHNQPVNIPTGSHYVISNSFQCTDFTAGRDVVIEVAENRNIIIYATGDFIIGRDSQVIIPPSSTLYLYFEKKFEVGQRSEVNMLQPLDPNRLRLYNLGTDMALYNQQGKICGHLISPYGGIHLKQGDEFFGTIVAKSLQLDSDSALHWDGIPLEICNTLIADLYGKSADMHDGSVTDATTFSQWFTDVPGVNASVPHTLALPWKGSYYEYYNNAFFPIDGQVFGNEGREHNFNFTFSFAATFEHAACRERFFEFQGVDDVWVYIDEKLVMDIGGVLPNQRQVVEVDRLGLVDGQTYTLHFYFAQRNRHSSVFILRTDLPLESQIPFSVTAQFD